VGSSVKCFGVTSINVFKNVVGVVQCLFLVALVVPGKGSVCVELSYPGKAFGIGSALGFVFQEEIYTTCKYGSGDRVLLLFELVVT